jgi:hypothetical protein
MKTYSQFIAEAAKRSIGRLHHHLSKGHMVGFISASRGNLSPEENNRRTRELHGSLRKHGYAPVPVKGEYIEDHEGKQKKVREKSFMIHSHHGDHARLLRDLKGHGEKFGQDSVLSVSHKTGSTFHGTGKSDWVPKGKAQRIGGAGIKTGPEVEKGEFKTRLKKRPFIVGG